MPAAADDAPAALGRQVLARARPSAPGALVALLIVVIALQRGGYFGESWGVPTAACAWAVILAALLGERRRLRRFELVQLVSLGLLGVLALLSAAWTPGGLGSALPQAQLLALYLAALSAVYMVFRRATPLLVAVWGALALVCALALLTRLFPTESGMGGATGNRLSEPLGYWNSLGLWAAMTVALAIVVAGRSRPIVIRVAAAASCVPATATLYFTYSRGAWMALAVGLAVAVAVDPRRLGLITWILIAGSWPALGVLLASRASGLTEQAAPLHQAREDGRRFAVVLLGLIIAAGFTGYVAASVERRRRISRHARKGFGGVLVGACLLGCFGVVAQFGAPWTIARDAVHRFDSPPHSTSGDLNARLFEASGSGRAYLWRVAWDDWQRHPFAGSGAGSYSAQWYRKRTVASDATNAHELYLETLAELGPPGLALLLLALATPLAGAWRARRHPLAAGATAAYTAFLVHVAADWDWQLAAVGLAALCCGAALVIMARTTRSRPATARARVALSAYGIAIASFAMWSLYGAVPLGQARDALADGRWTSAEVHAVDAAGRIGGFSSLPWRLLGEARTALGEEAAARVALRKAVARDPSSWQAWYDLAGVTQGGERQRAIQRALSLNPLGAETRALAQGAGVTPSSP
jgi:O-antigen ligase/polysaccharide polymerase Wzy-like membrane protein